VARAEIGKRSATPGRSDSRTGRDVKWAVQTYLLRHGIAEDARSGQPDSERALTGEGEEKLRGVLKRARAAGVELSAILSSPYRRALQTAAIAAEVLEYKGKVRETRALLPEASPYDLWEELRSLQGESAVLLASHEPLRSGTAALLLASPSLQVNMKKGALVRIDCERLGREPRGVLKWMLTPALA
jgi:phosphohistidine phosphatase